MYGERVQLAAASSKQIQEQHQEVVDQVWVGLDLVTVTQNVWANQKIRTWDESVIQIVVLDVVEENHQIRVQTHQSDAILLFPQEQR